MSEQDTFPTGETDQPRDMTSAELDAALRWLEELAGKQGKSLDGLVTLDDTSLEDSPFKGLFDSDAQELPDWLREVPSVDDEGEELVEGESRLDWLARMASRESVEELPTLEWRRLTEGEEDEDGDLVDAMPETAAAVPGMPAAVESPEASDTIGVAPVAEETEVPAVVELMTAMAVAEESIRDAETDPKIDLVTPLLPPDDEVLPLTAETAPDALDAAPQAVPNTVTSASSGEDFGPDDLDEAMAWLEELAASQDAPIEDLPSVADRALASKLIAEAASGMSQGDELDISRLGIAMSGIYVGKTRLAPTGPLIGEGPADETPDSAIHAEVILATGTDGPDAAPDSLVAEAPGNIVPVIEKPIFEEVIVAGFIIDEPVDGDETADIDAPIADSTEEIVITEPSLADLMGVDAKPLSELLLEVDRLAVPVGTSLDDIASLLAADQTMVKVTPYTLNSTLDWLEGKETAPLSADALGISLVAAMPTDPDEAQVWLEQLAGETDSSESGGAGAISEAASNLELTEADLLDMPDDPDAAIAWIESLAANRDRAT